MYRILSLLNIIFIILLVRKVRKTPTSTDPLTTKEKIIVVITEIFVPLLGGFIYHHWWKKTHPTKAKQANKYSFLVFGLLLIVGGIQLYFEHSKTFKDSTSLDKLNGSQADSETFLDYASYTDFDTLGWETHTNTVCNYLVKIPQSVEIRKTPDEDPSTYKDTIFREKSSFKSFYIDCEKSESQENLREIALNYIEWYSEKNPKESPLYIVEETKINGNETVLISNNDISQSLMLIAYINIYENNYIEVRLGPVFEGSEKDYVEFFYTVISTIRTNRSIFPTNN